MGLLQSLLPHQRACSLVEIWGRKPPLTLPVFAFDLQSLLGMTTVTSSFKVRITVFKLRPKTLSCSTSPLVGKFMTTALPGGPTVHDSWLDEIFPPRKNAVRRLRICDAEFVSTRRDNNENRAKLIV